MKFDHQLVVTHQVPWQPSPRAGVWRKPLAREEAEWRHATSIVRYDPGASFPMHDHPLGEEILVLEGTFETNMVIAAQVPTFAIHLDQVTLRSVQMAAY